MTASLCSCGHERSEHFEDDLHCTRYCSCDAYAPLAHAGSTVGYTDLPVSQGARDLYERVIGECEDLEVAGHVLDTPKARDAASAVVSILAAADEKDVRSLLWARRVGKL